MKLVVWDDCWSPYADMFRAHLGAEWRVEACGADREWLLGRLDDATALTALALPPDALPHARRLKAFLFPGAGLLNSDPSAYPDGCAVVNVYEHEIPVAEYVLMTMLLHATDLLSYRDSFRAGHWDGSGRVGGEPHGELAGRTVGLFGYGRIGQAVAARARAFGMRVAAVSKGRVPASVPQPDFAAGPEGMAAVLQQSDFFVIAAPLTRETRGSIGDAELALLSRHAVLINVSRAEIVCEEDLYTALKSGRLAGAALDVWYRYPPPGETGHGSHFPFHMLPNVICTPHYCAWSGAMIERRISRMAENLNRLSSGQPLESVVLTGTWRA
jgi:phosphoglycerate dehydrogenase-like enzyme